MAREGSLSALAVSDNGHFVATGSMFDGTVEIYIAFNLQVSHASIFAVSQILSFLHFTTIKIIIAYFSSV